MVRSNTPTTRSWLSPQTASTSCWVTRKSVMSSTSALTQQRQLMSSLNRSERHLYGCCLFGTILSGHQRGIKQHKKIQITTHWLIGHNLLICDVCVHVFRLCSMVQRTTPPSSLSHLELGGNTRRQLLFIVWVETLRPVVDGHRLPAVHQSVNKCSLRLHYHTFQLPKEPYPLEIYFQTLQWEYVDWSQMYINCKWLYCTYRTECQTFKMFDMFFMHWQYMKRQENMQYEMYFKLTSEAQ